MVWVSMLIVGTDISLRLKKRRDFLSEIVVFFTTVIVEIDYVNLPLTDILRKVTSSGACGRLDFIGECIAETENGEDFNIAWTESVRRSALPFTRREREKLISLGGLLGTSDAQGQRSILALFSRSFELYSKKAESTYLRYGRLCITVSGFLGMGLFVIML